MPASACPEPPHPLDTAPPVPPRVPPGLRDPDLPPPALLSWAPCPAVQVGTVALTASGVGVRWTGVDGGGGGGRGSGACPSPSPPEGGVADLIQVTVCECPRGSFFLILGTHLRGRFWNHQSTEGWPCDPTPLPPWSHLFGTVSGGGQAAFSGHELC